MRKKIIVDICGADAPPVVIARGAIRSLCEQSDFDVVIAGPCEAACEALGGLDETTAQRAEILAADGFVTNHDNPAGIIKGMNDTSMVAALSALKEREDIAGMVCAGNTGCLMVGSVFRLGLFKGLRQPALSSALWNINHRYFCLCDCGANMGSTPGDIVDYARMGSSFMEAMNGVERARVGLINVGIEEGKGNDLAKEAYAALAGDSTIHFVGNIEGSDVLKDKADVLVCDGFTGNVILKTLEAAGMAAASMMGNPDEVVNFFDYNSLGGATFLGTRKTIVKAHGAADERTIVSCLDQVWRLETGGFIEKMSSRMV